MINLDVLYLHEIPTEVGIYLLRYGCSNMPAQWEGGGLSHIDPDIPYGCAFHSSRYGMYI